MVFVEILKKDELVDGGLKMVEIQGKEFLVARVGENYYVSDNRCPHMNGDLSHGELVGTIISCPKHHSQFDLVDGRVIRWTNWKGIKLTAAKIIKSPKNLKTYPVQIKEDEIFADLEE